MKKFSEYFTEYMTTVELKPTSRLEKLLLALFIGCFVFAGLQITHNLTEYITLGESEKDMKLAITEMKLEQAEKALAQSQSEPIIIHVLENGYYKLNGTEMIQLKHYNQISEIELLVGAEE